MIASPPRALYLRGQLREGGGGGGGRPMPYHTMKPGTPPAKKPRLFRVAYLSLIWFATTICALLFTAYPANASSHLAFVSEPGDLHYTQGIPINLRPNPDGMGVIDGLQLPAASGGTMPRTYTLTGPSSGPLPAGLSFNPNTGMLSGAPEELGLTTLTYRVTDADDASASVTFTFTVTANLELSAIADLHYTQGTMIPDLILPEATSGPGGMVTYFLNELSRVPGLTFDPETRTLSGTPSTAVNIGVRYLVRGTNGAGNNAGFRIIVNARLELDTPDNQNYTQGTAISVQLPEATKGTAPRTYTLTGPGGGNLPAGLTFSGRTLSGTPSTPATTTLTYEVTDANGASAIATFMVTVNAGLALTASGDQTYTRGTAISNLQLPEATGGTGTYTYTLTGILPPGLNFTAGTRTLSGTPNRTGTTTLTYTVTDTNGDSANATFTVRINAGLTLEAPNNQTYTQDRAINDLHLRSATRGTGTFTYTLTGVPSLPPGLTFDPVTRILSGTPSTVGTFTLTYTVTDSDGPSANATFTVIVNDSLALTAPVDQNYTLDTAINNLTLPAARAGDSTATFTYTLTGVPGGLTFTPNTRILSGTPSTAGTFTLTYTASHDSNPTSSAIATFTVIVNDGLALTASANQNYTRGTAINNLPLPAATGGTAPLVYTLTGPSGLPPGLNFTASTRTLSGTPNTADTTTLTYEVMDTNGASTNVTFTVNVSDGLALTASGNQNYTRGTAISNLQLPEATGGTGTLTYTLTGTLPPGLNFTAGTRTLSGTPNTAGTFVLTYTVTDTNGASTATFTVTVNASLGLDTPDNQNYRLGTAIPDLELPEATGGTAPLTYTLTSLPPGLTFAPGTRTLSGTPSERPGITLLTYEVTDANGASEIAAFTVTVRLFATLTIFNFRNDLPANQNYTQGTAIPALTLPEAAPGMPQYTLTGLFGGPLPVGLEFEASTRMLSGTPSTAGTFVLTYTATNDMADDGRGGVRTVKLSEDFRIIVNARLELDTPGNQNYTRGTAISNLQLPEATGGTGTLTYTLTGTLPTGLTFAPGTRTLSGTPSTATSTTTLTYMVTDTNNASANATFTVSVSDGLALTAPANQNYTLDTMITDLQLPEATGGTGTLTYTLTNVPGLDFDPGTRTLSGTPNTAGTTTLTYEVTDDNGDSTATFTVTVNAELALDTPDDQNYTEDTAISDLQLPVATGGTAPLTYTLTSVPGLDFNANTRTLSGTPSTPATTTLTYEVMDANGASKSVDFTVTVNADLALTAPANQNYTLNTAITALQLPEATDGTGTLTYTLTGPSGGNLPAGLIFTPGTRMLSGTPSTPSTTTLTYTVTDDDGASTATFTVRINAGLMLETPGNQIYTQNTAIPNLTLPEATGGTAPLTYTLTGPRGVPEGLAFNPQTRTLSGTPSAIDDTMLTYTVTDTNGASTNATFRIFVNSNLTFVSEPADQNYTQGIAIDTQLPEATGGTGTFAYTLTGQSNVPLPAGLTFNPDTRILSGTPSMTWYHHPGLQCPEIPAIPP